MNELTQRGIAALKAGDRITARQLLSAALRQNPADLQAWLWMSGAVERDEERLDCLRHIQRLEPDNQVAAKGIAQILEKNPHLRPKVEQPLRPIDTTPQPRMAVAPPEVVITQEKAPGDLQPDESYLLDRVIQLPQQNPEAPARSSAQAQAIVSIPTAVPESPGTAVASNSTAGASPSGSGRVIPIVFPRRPPVFYHPAQRVFRSRPSLVPVMLFFWLMVILLYAILAVGGQSALIQFVFPAVLGLGVVGGLVMIVVMIRQYNTRYELTTEVLSLPQAGKKLELPVWSILTVEVEQSAFQKLLGTGDILVDVPLDGILSRVRIRDIPEVKRRAEQIQQLVIGQP